MDFTSAFFILMSCLVVLYLIYTFWSGKRVSLLIEIFYLGIYVSIGLIFLFPQILTFIENLIGIKSAINFIVYLSIFVAYLLILTLYWKTEEQRTHITKLVREIAYLKSDKKK